MIYADIHRQRLKLVNEHVAADTIDYLEMKFTFQTDDWDGLAKWAHFACGDAVYDIPLTDDCIRKEDHLNLSAGMWQVYLHGNEFADGEVVERITTCIDYLRVLPTGTLDGEPFPEIPASETERILARLAEAEKAKLSPIEKSDTMTQPVGRDAQGRLWTIPGGSGGGGGGIFFEPGNALEMENGVLNVKTTDTAETDNTLPITSSGVYTIVGNIGAILDTI